ARSSDTGRVDCGSWLNPSSSLLIRLDAPARRGLSVTFARRSRRRRGRAKISIVSGTVRSTSCTAPPGAARCFILATVQSPLEFTHNAAEVAVHRCSRTIGVVLRDRAENGGVVAYRLVRELVGVKVPLCATPELRPLIP